MRKEDYPMSVILSQELAASEVWLKIKSFTEKEMTELGLGEHVVNIRTETKEESSVIVNNDRSICCQYNPNNQTMDFIMHKSVADPCGPVVLDGPKNFVKIHIIDALLQFTMPDEQ